MKFLVLLFALTICGGFARELDQWEQFKLRFGKRYANIKEEFSRKIIFDINLKKIEQHEELRKNGGTTFSMGITEFADMTNEEYARTMLSSYTPRIKSKYSPTVTKSLEAEPDTVDWRTTNCVRPVENGGQCSLWPLTSLIPIEVQQCNASGVLTRLSVQNVWDCTDTGCSSYVNEGYDYIILNGGVDTEASYPSTGLPGACKYNPDTVGARISGYVTLAPGDEASLQTAVANIGPVSTAIDASQISFQLYVSGVYDDSNCSSDNLDLAMPIVGYGTETGSDYWLCQNSWGTSWGEQGYVKIARNKGNRCGIATEASYPLEVTPLAA